MKVIIVFIVVLTTFFLIQFARILVKRFSKKYRLISDLKRLIPVISPIIWVVVGFWSMKYLFRDEVYYNLVMSSTIVIISALLGWFFMKDFIAGIVFRLQNKFTKGDYIQFGNFYGHLESMLLTHILIQTKENKLLKIPYSRLSSEVISEKMETKSFEESKFAIETNKTDSIKTTESAIRKMLLASPWLIINNNPEVNYISENELCYQFEIHVQARNNTHINYVKEAINKKFGLKR